jgi:hypothetical protein
VVTPRLECILGHSGLAGAASTVARLLAVSQENAEQIAPSNVNVPVFALSLVWVLGFCFVLPPLARKWGRPGKAIAGLMTSVGAVALLIGILQGQDEIDKINRNYHVTHPAGSYSTQSGH